MPDNRGNGGTKALGAIAAFAAAYGARRIISPVDEGHRQGAAERPGRPACGDR